MKLPIIIKIKNPPTFLKMYDGFDLGIFLIVLNDNTETKQYVEETINHETIHFRQELELLFIFFFILYGIFYLYNLIKYKNSNDAYFNIPFEKEAYNNEKNLKYLKKRKLYSWLKYF